MADRGSAGVRVLMGAPNLVRGGSHAGNAATAELAKTGVLDVLSSDSMPASLLIAALRLPRVAPNIDLAAAVRTVTKTPAHAVGLDDRGEIAVGKRGDVIRVYLAGEVPVVLAPRQPCGMIWFVETRRRLNPDRVGPGHLILVVGPSGAGKDTLIAGARAACVGDRSVVFPGRVITRPSTASEDHDSISQETFAQAVAVGDFSLWWDAPRVSAAGAAPDRTSTPTSSSTMLAVRKPVSGAWTMIGSKEPPNRRKAK